MNNTNNDITIGGKWKILGKQYSGDLTFNKTNGIIILSIYYKDNEGFIDLMNKPADITIITGKLNQEINCTLVDCRIIKRHSNSFVRHHMVIKADTMFINISNKEKTDIKFNEVHFRIPNIIKWSQLSGFEYMKDPSYHFKIGYKFKNSISEKINDNTTIEFVPVFGKFNFDMQVEELDISQHVEIRIKKKEATPFEDFFEDFDIVVNLITLAIGLKVNVSLVQGVNYNNSTSKANKKNNIKYEIIKNTINNTSTNNPDKIESIRNYLFYLPEFASAGKLKIWFDTYKDYKNIYNLYNLGINNHVSDEIKFCNLMQALELIHLKKYKKTDKFFKHIEEKFKDNKEIINLIEKNPDQVNNDKYIILKNRIIDIFINDFNLTNKENLIEKIDKISTIFSDTRNYYTHYDDAKKDKCLVGKNLKYGIYILDYLVSNYILQNLNFNMDEINSKKDYVLNNIHNEKMIDKIIKNERIKL